VPQFSAASTGQRDAPHAVRGLAVLLTHGLEVRLPRVEVFQLDDVSVVLAAGARHRRAVATSREQVD